MIEVVIQAIKNLRRNGIRTFLTLIGIVIGITAIISLISIGNGLNNYFESQFEDIGSNSITVSPGNSLMGSQNSVSITDEDISFIKRLSMVSEVITEYGMATPIKFNNETKNALLFTANNEGYDFFVETNYFELVEGRFVEKNELSTIMLDETLAKKIFDKEINLRKQIEVNGEKYTVVGVFKFGVNTGDLAFGQGMALTSLKGFDRIYPNPSPIQVLVKTRDITDVDLAAEQIEKHFEKKYGKRSVTVVTSEQTIQIFNDVLNILTIVLAGIASISLVVGGIGIMNAMITSVLERTKEIGLMKALGASNKKILTMFLLESAFIGLIGGAIGVICSILFGLLVTFISTQASLPLKIGFNIELIVGAIIFSMLVGMISGFYPALKAANLDPIEAIRFE